MGQDWSNDFVTGEPREPSDLTPTPQPPPYKEHQRGAFPAIAWTELLLELEKNRSDICALNSRYAVYIGRLKWTQLHPKLKPFYHQGVFECKQVNPDTSEHISVFSQLCEKLFTILDLLDQRKLSWRKRRKHRVQRVELDPDLRPFFKPKRVGKYNYLARNLSESDYAQLRTYRMLVLEQITPIWNQMTP
jgi:hypothetical protein